MTDAGQGVYRTLDDRFSPPRYSSLETWKGRAAELRTQILATAGLVPMPDKTPLRPEVFGEVKRADYIVSKVYFESLPGFFVTGNLYRPASDGPLPAILSPHGHWTYGRLENTSTNSGPGRAIGLARLGFVVFTYDMVGYLDSQQLPHTFGGRREELWGLSLAGLQLWNSIRAIDFLESLPYVKRDAIAATGESGGGTQTFLLAAVDVASRRGAREHDLPAHAGRLPVRESARASPRHEQRRDCRDDRAAPAADDLGDRRLDEGDDRGGVSRRSARSISCSAPRRRCTRSELTRSTTTTRPSREAMYAWMARWLKNAPPAERIAERAFTLEPLQDLLVFYQRPRPPNAVTQAQLTEQWIESAKKQLVSSHPGDRMRALRSALGYPPIVPARIDPPKPPKRPVTVLLDAPDPALERELSRRGFRAVHIRFTTFDEAAASKIRHFETYNRTPASQRVADIVSALGASPGAAIVARGDNALAAIFARRIAHASAAVLDVDGVDPASDEDYLKRLFIPGLRRAGGFETAGTEQRRSLLHNTRGRFKVTGFDTEVRQLTAREIADAIATRAAGR